MIILPRAAVSSCWRVVLSRKDTHGRLTGDILVGEHRRVAARKALPQFSFELLAFLRGNALEIVAQAYAAFTPQF